MSERLFTANSLRVVEQETRLIVGIGEVVGDGIPERFVVVSRDLDPARDWPGINGVHIERDGEPNTATGGIFTFELRPDSIRICSNAETAAAVFAGYEDIEIGLAVGQDDLDAADGALERVFLHCNCYASALA